MTKFVFDEEAISPERVADVAIARAKACLRTALVELAEATVASDFEEVRASLTGDPDTSFDELAKYANAMPKGWRRPEDAPDHGHTEDEDVAFAKDPEAANPKSNVAESKGPRRPEDDVARYFSETTFDAAIKDAEALDPPPLRTTEEPAPRRSDILLVADLIRNIEELADEVGYSDGARTPSGTEHTVLRNGFLKLEGGPSAPVSGVGEMCQSTLANARILRHLAARQVERPAPARIRLWWRCAPHLEAEAPGGPPRLYLRFCFEAL